MSLNWIMQSERPSQKHPHYISKLCNIHENNRDDDENILNLGDKDYKTL